MQGTKQPQFNPSDPPSAHRQEQQAFQTRMVQETQSYVTKLGVETINIDWLIQDLEQL